MNVDINDRDALLAYKEYLFAKSRIRLGATGQEVPYEPHAMQAKIHRSMRGPLHFDHPAEWQYMVASCGRRTGKTLSAAMEIIYVLGLPQTKTWVVAPNYGLTDRVFDIVWDQIVRRKIYGDEKLRRKFRTRDKRLIETKWGSILEGKSGEAPDSLVGEQLDLLVLDEAARLDSNVWYECLEPSLLDRKGRVFFISTPRGHNWYYNLYLHGLDEKTRGKGWKCMQFRTEDNPFIDKEWLASKKMEVPQAIWKQEYEGSFEHFSGLIYRDYKDALIEHGGHLYDPDEREVDFLWTGYRGIDVGFADPTACLWCRVDPFGNIWVHQEYQIQNVLHKQHAQTIRALTSGEYAMTYISRDATRRQGVRAEEQSAADVYEAEGIYTLPANQDVWYGISQVSAYLRATLEDSAEHPRIYVSTRCTELRKQLMSYVFADSPADRNAIEKPKKHNDHLVDALRYVIASRPEHRDIYRQGGQQTMEERYGYQEGTLPSWGRMRNWQDEAPTPGGFSWKP